MQRLIVCEGGCEELDLRYGECNELMNSRWQNISLDEDIGFCPRNVSQMVRIPKPDDVGDGAPGSQSSGQPAGAASNDLRQYMVGPAPTLLPLSDKPNSPGFYIFADGHIAKISGFVDALLKDSLEKLGLCRRVPLGIDLTSDQQKLSFLGIERFGPSIPKDVMEVIMRGDLRPTSGKALDIETILSASRAKSL